MLNKLLLMLIIALIAPVSANPLDNIENAIKSSLNPVFSGNPYSGITQTITTDGNLEITGLEQTIGAINLTVNKGSSSSSYYYLRNTGASPLVVTMNIEDKKDCERSSSCGAFKYTKINDRNDYPFNISLPPNQLYKLTVTSTIPLNYNGYRNIFGIVYALDSTNYNSGNPNVIIKIRLGKYINILVPDAPINPIIYPKPTPKVPGFDSLLSGITLIFLALFSKRRFYE